MTTQTEIRCTAYEAGRAIVVELDLPTGVEVDTDGLSVSRMDGVLELRLPTTPASEEEAGEHMRGFHPDAAPT